MTEETTTERMVNGERASAAMAEFIEPALALLRAEYTHKLSKIIATNAMEGQPLKMVEKLAMAVKIVDQVEAQIRAVIADGEMAKADADRAGAVARLSPEQSRFANY